MTGSWRAIPLAAAIAFAAATSAFAQAPQSDPPPPPATPAPKVQAPATDEPFGVEVTLTPKTIIFLKGSSGWDKAQETLLDAFKSVYALVDKQGLKKDGPAMTLYTQADDAGFNFEAAVPITEAPKDLPKGDIAVGQSPGGKALKFVHRGSYDSMDNTYEAITNYLDQKGLEAGDVFLEEYETDLLTTPDDKLVVSIYVLPKQK